MKDAQFNGEKLRRRRRVCDMTARELADRIGVSPWTVSSWETGKHTPTEVNVRRMANALETGAAAFFDGEDPAMARLLFLDGESVDALAQRFEMTRLEIESAIRGQAA